MWPAISWISRKWNPAENVCPAGLGTKQMLSILEDIVEGRGREGDIERLEEIARGVKLGSLVRTGSNSPQPGIDNLALLQRRV